jgi:hypothetical protein
VQETLGSGRFLITVYAIFAVSASARSTYQLIYEFEQAPVAYSLSLFAAFVYLAATFLLASRKYRKYAGYVVWFELVGVVLVGFLSLLSPNLFNHPSVWSGFGIGYGFVPLVLPLFGLLWLRSLNART